MNRRALVVVAVGLSLLAIASTIRSGWLYLVASALFAIVLYGLISGLLETRGIELDREVPAEVFERQPFTARVTVTNKGRLNRYLCSISDMQFEEHAGSSFVAGTRRRRADWKAFMNAAPGQEPEARGTTPAASISIEKLPAGSEVRVGYEMMAPGRGLFEEAPMVIKCGGVLGVSGIRRTSKLPSPIVVFPQVSRLRQFPFVPVATAAPVETYEWERKGPGQDYYGVREYVSGDSLRHIHWPSSAKMGKLIVKEYRQEYMPVSAVLLLLEDPVRGSRYENSVEDSLRAAASVIAYYAGAGTIPRLLSAGSGGVEELEGGMLESCLRSLALFQPSFGGKGPEAATALERARSVLPGESGVAVMTNLPISDVIYLLSSTAASGIAVAAAVDASYGGRRQAADYEVEIERLAATAEARAVALYVITADRDVGECLKDPLTITGA